MGIDASRSANRNRSNKMERRNGFRNMLCENLERREVMAGDILDLDFRLLSVAPNSGEILSTTRANELTESPRELVFRFVGGEDIQASTLRNGIRITRAGGDGIFGAGGVATDIVVGPDYLDFADSSNKRVVVARFSQPLADDMYRVEVFGTDTPAAVRTIDGDPLKPRKVGTTKDTYDFNLELGTKIVAVVPQPIVRQANGSLQQNRDQIEIYFNDSELYDKSVNTGDLNPNPSVVDPQYYKLMLTQESVSPNDDIVFSPISVSYNPTAKRAVLTFANPIDQLPGVGNSGTFRLRVGSNEAVASALTPISPLAPVVAADPAGFLSGAFQLNSGNPLTGSFSAVVSEEIRNATTSLPNDFPGSNFEPGHRDIQDESHLGGPDEDPEITQLQYSFMDGVPYGTDAAGRPVYSSITPDQKQRVREIFEFYSQKLGLDAVEFMGDASSDPDIYKVVVGDLYPNAGPTGPVSGPGDVIGLAGGRLAIMDGAEAWDNTFGYGSELGTENFFPTAMHEIGHMLGYSHTYDLPNGTIMGEDTRLNAGTPPIEQIFPGINDVIHGQHMYRPDNRDVDLYRFVVAAGATGSLRAETIAERLNDSSNADTHLTLLRLESDGTLTTVASNDNYFSDDAFVSAELQPGEYFLSVTGSGNQDNNPLTGDTGSGATSQGRYDLRIDFKSTTASSIVEQKTGSNSKGSPLDGDGDGIAGGNFDFWFRAASPVGTAGVPAGSPRTIVVDKAFTGVSRDGSLAKPFNRITEATMVAAPGDIIRLVGDTRTSSLTDDAAYEIGFGGASVGTLRDGASLDVPRGVTLMVDAGAILKFGGSRVLVGSVDSTTNRSGASIQVLGTPTTPVYFTSYFDQSLGIDTNPLITSPQKGDWGGIEIRNDIDRTQGRTSILMAGGKFLAADKEREGIFLNTISNADIRWGGGVVGTGAQSKVVSPIDMAEARPLIIGNKISNSADSAMSVDPNALEETLFTEPRYQSGGAFIPDYGRVGPKIYSNMVTGNSINGLFVRAETLAGQPLKELTVPGRIDDSEITVVFGENIIVQGTPGGAMNEVAKPNTTLLTLSNVAPTSGSGFSAAVALNYIVTFIDRFGQESLPSASKSVLVNAGAAIRLNNLPAATGDYVSRRIWRQVNASGAYRLAGVLNRDDTSFVDNNITLNGSMQTSVAQTEVNRARRDASLVVDPGIVAKMLGGRIEVGIGATLLAEGTESKPVVFTSRRDDRYGAGGTFDTNNDVGATLPAKGDWSGIVSRHLGTLSIDSAIVNFGGGESRIPGGFASFNAVEVHQSTARIANTVFDSNASGATNLGATNRDTRGVNEGAVVFVLGSQPVIINNVFKNNNSADTAAISVDANSLNSTFVRDWGRSTGENQRENVGIGNFGPLVSNNQLGGNSLNGMRVRGAVVMTESVWDDTDIVHLLRSNLVLPDYHTYGGLRLVSKADESLVVKASNGASITAEGRPLDIKDRIGGTVQVIGQPGFPVVITSLADDSIGAGFDYLGNSLLDTNNNGPSSGVAGDWKGITFTPFSNDRNVDFRYEREPDQISEGSNDFPSDAEDLGSLASNLNGGDENLRLGVTLTGSIASPRDLDVYRFSANAGTTVWIDVDQTSGSLDSIVELVDGNGQIIALSDNSIAESVAKTTFSDPSFIPDGRVLPMDQSAWAKTNANEPGAQVDFLGVNPLDAGFRVVLPGVAGSFNNYFLRVRSSNVSQEPGKNDPARLTSPALVREGITTGGYKVQLRMQQQQEVAGSAVRFADIRYAQIGIDVQGGPMHSPLLGEVGELDPNETNFSDQSAINLGNIITNDRAGTSIAANLASRGDIDWYNFSVSREAIQQVSTTPSNHIALTFDIDYADGQGRANTQLWVFRRDATSGQLTLVAMANDSNIQDDQARVNMGADLTDLTRGSQGKRDAYLGPIELPQGDYTVAVTNASLKNVNMDQFTTADGSAGSSTVRVEPLDSVQVISEDRFDADSPSRPSRNAAPVQESFALNSTSTSMPNVDSINYADRVISYNPLAGGGPGPISGLDDPRAALGRPDYLPTVEPSPNQGAVSLGNGGTLVVQFTDNLLKGSGDFRPDLVVYEVGDSETVRVEVSADGTNFTFVGVASNATPLSKYLNIDGLIDSNGVAINARSQFRYVRLTDINTNGAVSGDSVGADIDAVGAITNAQLGLPNAVPFNLSDVTLFASASDRMMYANALTGAKEAQEETPYSNNRIAVDIAVSPAGGAWGAEAPRGTGDAGGSFIFGINIGDVGDDATGRLSSASAGLVTYHREFDNANPPNPSVVPRNNGAGDGMNFHALCFADFGDLGNAFFFGVASRNGTFAGGNEAEWQRNIIYRLDPATGNAIGAAADLGNMFGFQNRGSNFGSEAGTSVRAWSRFATAVGTVRGVATVRGTFFGVTEQGELVREASTIATLRDPITNTAINFTGLTTGPRNVENGKYADLLFGVTSSGRIYAFNTAGVLQPIFPLGQSFTQTPGGNGIAGVVGIDFSSFDVNLWHASLAQSGQPGHGRTTNFNNSRDTSDNQIALRFAVDTDGNNGDSISGNWGGIYSNLNMDNSYAVPGGAMGALESDLIDLRNYSADDQPMLYFNYLANTQENNAASVLGDNTTALDSLRVYGTSEDGGWVLLSTSNSNSNTDFSERGSGSDEYDLANTGNEDSYGRTRVTEELFDRGQWRQARVNLGALAGKRDIKLRFEFSTVGDFRSADPLRGGIELGAVPGERIVDGDTMTVAGTTFEFDLGLVLNVPSGQSIVDGDQLKIGANTFTFTNTAGPSNIPFSANDTPALLAASIRTVLKAAGFTVATSTGTTNVLNVTELNGVRLAAPALPTTYDIIGADKNIIIGLPGVAGTNSPIFVTNEMNAIEVRDAVRTGFAAAFNIAGQKNNIDVYPVRGNVIVLHSSTAAFRVSNPGPLTLFTRRTGDNFGPVDGGDRFVEASKRTRGNKPATNLVPAGIFLDDFIIGFAERGEMVTGTSTNPGGQTFNASRFYEQYGGPLGTPVQEVATGTYQLEIRVAADYGTSLRSGDLRLETIPFPPTQLGRTFDTNERLTKSAALIFNAGSTIQDGAVFPDFRSKLNPTTYSPDASNIIDGASFTLSDGVNTVSFEFEVVTSANDRRVGVTPGFIPIAVSPNDSSVAIARAIRDAINSASAQGLLNLSAENGGDMPGATTTTGARSQIIQINGSVAVDALGSTNFPAGIPLTLQRFGQDTKWGEDLGDANINRDQGQLLISSAVVSNSLNYGIRVDAAARDYAATRFGGNNATIRPGNRPYPGAVRNLVTLNTSNVAPGVVLMNNVLSTNNAGGILISGDTASSVGQSTLSIARIVNNTIYGAGVGTGLTIEQGATPTVLNNIIANSNIGVAVTGGNTANVVLGGNIYKQNGSNVNPGGISESFRIPLNASDPLFLNPTLGRFYLAPLSQAIDSSLSSLENRSSMETVKSPLGLPTSPILAPEFDASGLRRSDDPNVNSPPGLGSNVFIDRGALDRVDQIGPIATIQRPLDNDANSIDIDPSNTYVHVQSGNFDFFEILLDERQGTGPDPLSINKDNLVLTENGRMLSPGVDYVFGYSYNSRTIRLTPLAGFWRQDSVYEMTLINKSTLRIIAPDDAATRSDGAKFTVTLQGGGTRTLELDSGYTITVPTSGVADGQFFTYTPAGGNTVRFEFDSDGKTTYGSQVISFTASDTAATLATKIASALNPLVKQNGFPVQAIPGGRVSVGGNVGDVINVTGSSLTLSGTPGASAGATPVRFVPIASFDAFAMATAMTKALNQVGSGVKAYSLAGGIVFIEGVTSVSGVTSLSLSPIVDLAANPLQANRANALTQFTILMPEVAVDYGDAIERSGTGAGSTTLLANNGVRHGLYPDDATLLVLGSLADGETDGQVSAAADGDDFDSGLSLGTLANYLSIAKNGPARLTTSPFNAGMIGKSITISDTVAKSVKFEFTNGGATIDPAARGVDLTGAVTADDVAVRLQSAILAAILDGSITGIHASVTGNTISLGGSAGHLFDVSASGGFVQRALNGSLGLSVNADLTGLTAGSTMSISDGSGNTVVFQVIDTNTAAPVTSLAAGNVAVRVNLATATASDLANALAAAINSAISDNRLRLPTVSVTGTSFRIAADDEDGVQFNSWFNSKALATPISITASAAGFVDAWIDWNQDNDFEDAGEKILTSEPVIAGSNTFFVSTPASAAIGFTTSRFRLSTTGGAFTYGLAIGGETEDHLIEVISGEPPTGTNDNYTIAEDNKLVVAAAGVLTNDLDPDGQLIRVFDSDLSKPGVQPVLGPQHGTLTINADGSFEYNPYLDFFGTDTFIYLVTDPRMTANVPTTVTINVTPVNDAPVAKDDVVTILEDTVTSWNGSDFTGNDRTQPDRVGFPGDLYDTNESGQKLTIIDAQLVVDRGLGESLTLVNNVVTYTPPTDYNNLIAGPVLVKILIQDSGVAGGDDAPKSPGQDDTPANLVYSTLTININDVNDAPVFNIPRPVQTPLEDASVVAPGFLNLIFPAKSTALDELGSVPGVPGQTVDFLVRALDPTRFTASGQPKIAPDGTLTYTLNTDVNFLNSGNIVVEVIARDNGPAAGTRPPRPDVNLSAPKLFTIVTTEVNDAPLFDIPKPEILINEDLENSPINGFLTNIVAGPPTATDELGLNPPTPGQTVSFEVVALDPTRFNGAAGQPKISSAGVLTYDLAPDVNQLNSGPILVRVTAVDSGPATGDRAGIPDVNRSITKTFTLLVQDVNDAPQFTIPSPVINIKEDLENSPVSGFITNIVPGPASATDEVGQTVTFTVVALDPTRFNGAAGQPRISSSGVLTYDLAPDVNQLNSGPIVVTVTAFDSGFAAGSRPGVPDNNQSTTQTFTIFAQDVNDAPQFTVPNPVISILEDLEVSPLSGFITNIQAGPNTAVDELGLVTGVTGQTVSFTVEAVDPTRFNGAAGQPKISPTGVLTYDLAPDVNQLNSGPILIKVTAVDNGNAPGSRPGTPDVNSSATVTVTLMVTEVNDAPLFTIPNPLIQIQEDLEVSPVNGFVTNIVAGPPTATDELGLIAGLAGQTITFDVRAVDPTRFNGTAGQPKISPTGVLTYDLAPDINRLNSGDIFVIVNAVDSGSSTAPNVNRSITQTFTIRVAEINDAPIFDMASTTYNVREDAGFQTLTNFITNLGPGPLTATDEVTQTTKIVAVAVDPSAFSVQPLVTGTGDLTFQLGPDVNSLFKDLRIRLIATDDGLGAPPPNSNTTEKVLTVIAADINDEPLYNIPVKSVSVFEDNEQVTGKTPTVFPAFATNIKPGPSTAIDEANQKLTFRVTFSSNPNLFSVQPSINSTTGDLSFVTAPDQNGTAVLIVRLEDDGRPGPFPNDNIGANETFTIIIRPVNDAPQFTIPASITSDEDQGVVSISGFATSIRPGPATAADESTQELAFDVGAVDPTAFAVQPSLLVDGTLIYQTAKDINRNSGLDTRVVVTLRDNGLSGPPPNTNVSVLKTFVVNINPVNDPPIPDAYLTSASEDTKTTVQASDVLAGDLPGPADEVAEGQQVRITNIEQITAAGGTVVPIFNGTKLVSFEYIPPLNFVGQDTVRYVVTDDATYKPGEQSATGTVTINVGPINDPPSFTPGSDVSVLEDSAPYSAPWATNIVAGPPAATDELASQTVSFKVMTDNDAMFAVLPTIDSTGKLSFTLAKDANGVVRLVAVAVDSGPNSPAPNNNSSAPATFNLNVAAVNDPPDFNISRSIVVAEDSGAFTGLVLADIVPAEGMNSVPPTALDEASQTVTIAATADKMNLFSTQPTIDANGVLRFTPAPDASGSAIITVVATDNGPSTSPNINISKLKSFTITITAENDAPVANNDRYRADERFILNVPAPGVISNDTDADLPGDSLSIANFQSTSDLGAKVSLATDGALVYDPTGSVRIRALVDGQTINDTFVYRLKDAVGRLSNYATVTVTVDGFNDAPVAVNDSFTVPFGVSQLLNVLANDTDLDTPLDQGSIEIGRLAVNGVATATSTGRVRYVPNPGFRGSDSFTYRVKDSLGKWSNEATVSITVNTAPVAANDAVVTERNKPISINVTLNDFDPDGFIDRNSVNIVTLPDSGTAVVQPGGNILYTPLTNFTGVATFQYVVSDNEGLSSNVADVTVRVVASLFQNPNNKFDVNADTFVSPIDVLVLVNLLNSQGPSIPVSTLPGPPDYVDVNGDGFASPLDVVELINFINSQGGSGSGEGEGNSVSLVGIQSAPAPELVLAAEARNVSIRQSAALEEIFEEEIAGYGPLMASDDSSEVSAASPFLSQVGNDTKRRKSSEGALDDAFLNDDWFLS